MTVLRHGNAATESPEIEEGTMNGIGHAHEAIFSGYGGLYFIY